MYHRPEPRTIPPGTRELVGTVTCRVQEWDNGDSVKLVLAVDTGHHVVVHVEDRGQLPAGTCYRFYGRANSTEYGHQFAADAWFPHAAPSRLATVAFLIDVCDGVGRKTAERLFDRYGGDAVQVLLNRPEKAVEDGLLGDEVAKTASEAIREAADLPVAYLAVLDLLKGRGFPRRTAMAAVRLWRGRAPEVIRTDPFELMLHRLPGAGFKKCDHLYRDLGLPPGDLRRQMLCAWHDMADEDRFGHVWFPAPAVAGRLREDVGEAARPKDAFRLGLDEGWLASQRHGGEVYLAVGRRAEDERVIADSLWLLRQGTARFPVTGGSLTEHQRERVAKLAAAKVGLLIGPPGTGKTFCAVSLIADAVARDGASNVAVCAPTGKAASRLTQVLRQRGLDLAATTIHGLLQARPAGAGFEFQFGLGRALPHRHVLVDEASMVDAALLARLLSACAPTTRVLLVGDRHQLPPVGPGAPLRDLLAAGLPVAELSEILRNSGRIVRTCHRIKDGQRLQVSTGLDLAAGENLICVPAVNSQQAIERICDLMTGARGPMPQVIVARNGTRRELNRRLQALLNPHGERVAGRVFRRGDRVINLRNRTLGLAECRRATVFVANGDMGTVTELRRNFMMVRLDAGGLARVPFAPLGQAKGGDGEGDDAERDADTGCTFTLGYAITAHKSQGSEWPATVVYVEPGAGWIASREWVYTALSRAKQLCYLVGSLETANDYVRRQVLPLRKTLLAERLRRELL
jgi:exodeoxyribonuclease V alpha subunit